MASVEPWRPRGIELRGGAEALPATDDRAEIIRIHPDRVLSWGIDTGSFDPPRTRDLTSGTTR